jgi:AcrR family transcriptional regulator
VREDLDAPLLLDRLFRRHPESTRTMAVLHHVDGMTLEQVARECGMSVSGVRKRLRDRLRALERSNAEILAQHPAPAMTAAIAQRASPPVLRRATRPRLALAAALVAAALVAGVVLLRPAPGARDAQDVTRIKGSAPRLALYRKGPGGIEALPSGSVAHGRDLVQLSYQAAGRRYGVIVSVDGNGAITRHLPGGGRGRGGATTAGSRRPPRPSRRLGGFEPASQEAIDSGRLSSRPAYRFETVLLK